MTARSASLLSASLLAGGEDTIVAIATAEGRGALATLRLSGARATEIASALGVAAIEHRTVRRVLLKHPVTGEPVDDALVTTFRGPASYTGEDIVEFSTHGGRIAPRLVLEACIAAGARLALPGEFTRRAVLNGRMDLLQAEAVGELIDAPTSAMHAQALRQIDGALGERFGVLRDELLHLQALIAYDIDFPEEDDGPVERGRVSESVVATLASLDALLGTVPRAAVLRHGALVVIAGPPNAGKSSLFNALLGEARALVTPVAGTTRDAIEAVLDTPGVPLRLVDTAGLRDTDDAIEQLGIEVSARYLASAELVLACGERSEDIDAVERVIKERTAAPVLRVETKSDLRGGGVGAGAVAGAVAGMGAGAPVGLAGNTVQVSATSGDGLGGLLTRMVQLLTDTWSDAAGGGSGATHHATHHATQHATQYATHYATQQLVVLRERQRLGLAEARAEVAAFGELWAAGELPAVIAAVHLEAATAALDSVIGSVSVNDILDKVFSEFCVGK